MRSVRKCITGFASAGLLCACQPPPIPEAGFSDAIEPACTLPAEQFAADRRELFGSRLGVPYNLLQVTDAGALLWNGVEVAPPRVVEYLEAGSRLEDPVILVVRAAVDAPCAAVQEALAAARRAGQCRPQRCVFEGAGAGLPAPPLLPDRALLLGRWRVASMNGVPPPPGAPAIVVIFTDGAVGAQSQCITYNWRIEHEDGRLKLRPPPGPVAMCARAPSPWETAFGATMASAAWIESVGEETVVTGANGTLRLQRLVE